MTRPAALLCVACVALFAPSLDHFFVSDDFLNIERNLFETVDEGLALFGTRDVDFYRPIPRLHFGVLSGLFTDRVVVWNVVGMLLHAAASIAALLLALDLLGRSSRRAARYAALAFTLHAIHVEPVVWASGVTSVYVGLFVFLSILLFRRARASGRTVHAVGSVLCFAGALLSKETAVVFVPLLILTTWWWPPLGPGGKPTSRWPRLREVFPHLLLLGAWLVIFLGIDRGGDASPYRLSLGPHVLKNGAFFLFGGFLPIRYWEIQQLWAGSDGLAAFARTLLVRAHLSAPLLLGAVALGGALWRGGRDVRGGFLWIAVAAMPFLFLPGSGERFQYVSSFGACLVLGLGAQALLRQHRRLRGGLWTARGIVLAGLIVLVLGAFDRQADWALAGRWSRGFVDRWSYFRQLDADEPIEFRGVPDAWRSAWVFRNGFSSMIRLYWEARPYWSSGEPRPPSASGKAAMMEVVARPDGTLVIGPANLRGLIGPGGGSREPDDAGAPSP